MLKDQQGPNEEKIPVEAPPRRFGRRQQAIVGAVGLAVIGGGAFAVAGAASGQGNQSLPVVKDMGGIAAPAGVGGPMAEPVAKNPAAAPAASASADRQQAPGGAADTGTQAKQRRSTDVTAEDRARARVAREANKKLGTEVRKPLAAPLRAPLPDSKVTVIKSGEQGKSLQIVSAKGDLTGQRELTLVGDKGWKVGKADCTNKVRFTADQEPVEKPSLLICWRLSAERSVYTLAVNVDGKPSAEASVKALNEQWKKLGD